MKKTKGEAGFTLIELMVAVSIVSILVLVGVPMYRTAQEVARVSADEANKLSLQAATELWEVQYGMTAAEYLAVDHDERMLKEHIVGTWIGAIPADPWGRDREYTITGVGVWQLLGAPEVAE